MLKCENIPVGSLNRTGQENETIPLFESLRVNSLGRGAGRHVQPSTDRVNINHRWNISHDTFYLMSCSLIERKMKWVLIFFFIKVEPVWQTGNDTGGIWIRDQQYLIQIACGWNLKINCGNYSCITLFSGPAVSKMTLQLCAGVMYRQINQAYWSLQQWFGVWIFN